MWIVDFSRVFLVRRHRAITGMIVVTVVLRLDACTVGTFLYISAHHTRHVCSAAQPARAAALGSSRERGGQGWREPREKLEIVLYVFPVPKASRVVLIKRR